MILISFPPVRGLRLESTSRRCLTPSRTARRSRVGRSAVRRYLWHRHWLRNCRCRHCPRRALHLLVSPLGLPVCLTALTGLLYNSVFRYGCGKRGAKTEEDSLRYALLSEVIRRGGLPMATMVRYSLIPGHCAHFVDSILISPVHILIRRLSSDHRDLRHHRHECVDLPWLCDPLPWQAIHSCLHW